MSQESMNHGIFESFNEEWTATYERCPICVFSSANNSISNMSPGYWNHTEGSVFIWKKSKPNDTFLVQTRKNSIRCKHCKHPNHAVKWAYTCPNHGPKTHIQVVTDIINPIKTAYQQSSDSNKIQDIIKNVTGKIQMVMKFIEQIAFFSDLNSVSSHRNLSYERCDIGATLFKLNEYETMMKRHKNVCTQLQVKLLRYLQNNHVSLKEVILDHHPTIKKSVNILKTDMNKDIKHCQEKVDEIEAAYDRIENIFIQISEQLQQTFASRKTQICNRISKLDSDKSRLTRMRSVYFSWLDSTKITLKELETLNEILNKTKNIVLNVQFAIRNICYDIVQLTNIFDSLPRPIKGIDTCKQLLKEIVNEIRNINDTFVNLYTVLFPVIKELHDILVKQAHMISTMEDTDEYKDCIRLISNSVQSLDYINIHPLICKRSLGLELNSKEEQAMNEYVLSCMNLKILNKNNVQLLSTKQMMKPHIEKLSKIDARILDKVHQINDYYSKISYIWRQNE
eukprot:281202_1